MTDMCLIILNLFTFFSLIIPETQMHQHCDNSICNYEAVCILNNGNPSCKCVEQFFDGEFCSKSTEHCSSNPCQNGGTCRSYPGHYHCECSLGFAGQTCTSVQDAFKGLHLHYNHIAPIGVEQSLMLIIQNVGTVETLMEFYKSDYIIDGIVFTSTSGHFIESNELQTIGRNFRIKHSENLPYHSGFYRITKASFWKLGINSMTLDLSDFGPAAENFFRAKFDIFVYDPTGVNCFPAVHLPHCLNPRKPLHMDIQTFNFIEPIVDIKCKLDWDLSIKWSVRNYINTVVLYKFPQQPVNTLTIPPYTMWFNYRDDFVQSYLIQGDVLEVDGSTNMISKTTLRVRFKSVLWNLYTLIHKEKAAIITPVFRKTTQWNKNVRDSNGACYVFVDSKPTRAFILGGPYREVNLNKELILDGSISRDYARHPKRNQNLQFSWSCTSDDIESRYCTQNVGSEPRLFIPAQGLQLHKTYKFTLLVRSSINIYSTHRTVQTLKAIPHDSLLINFICLRNCEHGKFSRGKLIHLKLECIKCPPGNITFSVRNEFGIEVANNQRVILTEESKHKVYLKAEAKLGSLGGGTSIRLTLNHPPNNGTCSVLPLSGIEYQTLFNIYCSGYEDEEKPIDYKFWLGNKVLDHSGDETLTTRLFRTSGEICEIRIKICDDIGACTDVQLQVALKPITKSMGTWLEFLSQKDSNLNSLIESGDRSAAFILIETVIRHITPDNSQEIVKPIVECLRNIKAERLLVVEQFLAIGNDLLGSMNITSESALLISELFFKISEGFLHAIKNDEILELQVETHQVMIGNLAEAMAKTSIEVEEFPVVHDAEPIPPEDPFGENYSDYGEIDINDVVHISNWLKSFQRMHKCLQVMGVVSAFVQLPGETPVNIKKKGITSMTLIVDESEAKSLSWSESKTIVNLPKEFLKSLDGNQITIQASIFESNPLWWNPEQYVTNSEIFSFGVYSKALSSLNSKTTKTHFSFFMQLKDSSEEIVTHGSVQNDLEMLVYERVLPENAVLVVTFLPLKYDIRVLLLMEKRPRRFMFKDSKVLRISPETTILYLINNTTEKRKAFLAISSKLRGEFSFTLTIRMCTTWNSQSLEWTSEYCLVGNQTNATHIHCSCWHLSMFGAKVYPTFGHIQSSQDFVDHLDISYGMLALLGSIIVSLCVCQWLAWRKDVHSAENIIILDEISPDRKATHEFLVTIFTNGHTHAGTTSNVTIKLHGSLSNSQNYTLYSKPKEPNFHRNAQTSFTLFLFSDLGALRSVSLSHDGFGRYPKWNCHMVKIRDELKRNEYIFMVNRWIFADSEPVLIHLSKEEELQLKCCIFKNSLSNIFANFYAEQAFSSQRLYGQLTAMEKASIFICKTCITIMGTLIVFGPTTIFTYEMEREIYYSMLLNFLKLVSIAFVCHIVGVVVTEFVHYVILKIHTKTNNLNYNLVLK